MQQMLTLMICIGDMTMIVMMLVSVSCELVPVSCEL